MEAEEIANRRPIDCVYAPIWDVEGIAFLHHHRFPLVTSLQTTLHFYLESNPNLKTDTAFMADFAKPMLALERRILAECDGIHAISRAIAAEIALVYDVPLTFPRTSVIPLAIEDWSSENLIQPPPLPQGILWIVFVGRQELRKGIDVLLAAAAEVLPRYPHAHLDVVGNSSTRAARNHLPSSLRDRRRPR